MNLLAEFIAYGTPLSLQASSSRKERWKATVAGAAKESLKPHQAPVADPVKITVLYFYNQVSVDLDNILKPILDALRDIVYLDDMQVCNLVAAKKPLQGSFLLADMPPMLIFEIGQAKMADFIYVSVEVTSLEVIL